jgi:hypothetical protein
MADEKNRGRVRRALEAFTSRGPRDAPPSREPAKGRSGTVNTRGFILDREFNRRLVWPLNLDEYEKMRRTDPTVRWMLALISTPIRAALWNIEPPENPTPEEMEATCFARHAIFEELDGGWDEHLRQALTYLDFGHSVFERVADQRTVEFDVDPLEAGGDPNHVKRDAFVLARLGPRLQRTIQRWIPDENDPAKLVKIVQWLADGHSPSTAEIDAERLVIYVNEKEGDDWRGVSILRSAWKSYFTKAELENMEAIAFERTAGLPVVYPPDEATPDQLEAVEEAVKAMRQGENVYLIMPGPKQQPQRSGAAQGPQWLVEDLAVDASAGVAGEYSTAISRYDTAMARNVMASFMQLGMQEVGARATADVQQDPYYQALEAHVGYIEDVFTESVLRPLIDWNYSVERYPRLVASKIQAKNVQVVAESIAALVKVGAVQPDEPLQDFLRELVDAPPRDPDYEEEEAEETEPPGGDPDDPSSESTPPTPTPGKSSTSPKGQGGGQQGQGEPGTGPSPGMAMTERFSQFVPPRPLRGGENHVAWQQVKDTLDNAELDIVSIGERVMAGQIASLSSSADEAVRKNEADALQRLALDPKPLAEALEDELTRLYATGQADVRAEVRRGQAALQDAGRSFPGEAMSQEDEGSEPPQIPVSAADVAALIAGLAATLAETASQAAVKAVKTRALKTLAQRKQTPQAPGEDPLAEMRAALRQAAPLASNRIYNLGRMDEIKSLHYAGMIPVLVYSAVLDGATCETCESEDGEMFNPETAPSLPNAFCDGGDRCRCIYVPELAQPGETAFA